jgi:ABC-type Fe3+-hydroxamate transport system substrate-binding protein
MYNTFTDQLSRAITINYPPQRIISLVPSQTELLFDLGLGERVVGITKFCIHPSNRLKTKTKVGGTKQVRINLIRNLKPDLIIGNKEENERSQIEILMSEFPVWMSDIADLHQAINMIKSIGQLTGASRQADTLALQIKNSFSMLQQMQSRLRVAYLIWQGPYMVAGKDTFIDDMLHRCGFINVFEQERYPVCTALDLQRANPDVIMLSSEPYPFKQRHIDAFKTIVPAARVILVDGEMFSWYGSRLQLAVPYFEQLITYLTT